MYGEGKHLRYVIGFTAVIILLFVIIFMIIHHGNGSSKVPTTQKPLTSYASNDNVTVTETIVGPIVAAQNHNELQISVTNSAASINLMKGYDGNVVDNRQYALSQAGFSEFLNSLEKAGFTNGNTDESLKDDSGYCSTGQRYIFEIHDGSKSIQRFWATSCGGTKTYKGSLGLTTELFQAQIPDYGDLTDNANFNSGYFNGL